ncbi:vacuolar alkaline phosphatase [Coemansia sp. RSA 560]|nr:vacuolar alkaline phosphatase [Coemansia sp. RSA 560]
MILVNLLLVAIAPHAYAKRNLVLMISDGFGPTSETMARSFMQDIGTESHEPWSSILDSMLTGSVRTQSSNSLVTDSAAGATAFACGLKTHNGAIAVDTNGTPCGTILEAAKNAGYATGLVTTSRITHATPASFAAHVVDRDMEDLIAMHMISKNATRHTKVDLMFGGGMCRFLPQSNDNSCRNDDVDVWQAAKDSGVTTLTRRSEFDLLSQTNQSMLPLIGLFAHSHMAYTIDRDSTSQPSLSEMTQTALNLLDDTSDKGFFLMVEGARIDMAGHDNDPAAHVHDIIEYWRTVQKVHQFVHSNPDTLVVSTSDHETGGLALGIDPEYTWHPRVLNQVTKSAEQVCSYLFRTQKQDVTEVIEDHVFPKYLGIDNHTQAELEVVVDALQVKGGDGRHKACKHAIGGIVSKRARVGWSTGGHTGADVGLYAYGNQMHKIKGNMENSHLGTLLMQYLDVSPSQVTKALANTATRQLAFFHSPHHDHD